MALTVRDYLIRLGEMWQTAAERLIPPMAAGFPKIREDLEWLQAAITDGGFVPDLFLNAAFGGREQEASENSNADGLSALLQRPPHPELCPHESLTDDTRLWAFMQQFGGGAWGGWSDI
ncbi:MAG: hypothetical protein HGA78_12015 [Nitrospirales bacterium]|nr:hypothetical protein [Nitrospirales bacterium]